MDVIRQITGAATQAGIATERVRQMVRIFDRNRAASMSTVDVLQRLATGNLSSGAELLTGASGAIALAGDLFPQVGTVLRSFNAAQASVGSILTAIDGSNFPLVRAAADSVKSALGGAWNQFNAAVGVKDSAVLDVIKSTGDTGYTELIDVEAAAPNGSAYSAAGTLAGKANQPRIVSINGREVEVAAEGKLLVLENLDKPGMVGEVGTILGKDNVNIADMSLSRLTPGGTAYMVVRVDTEPSETARKVIKGHPAIKQAKFVQL